MSRAMSILGWIVFLELCVGAVLRRDSDPTTEWLRSRGLLMPLVIALSAVSLVAIICVIRTIRSCNRMERLIELTEQNTAALRRIHEQRLKQRRK